MPTGKRNTDMRSRKHRLDILKILNESDKPMGSVRLVEELETLGETISERTVRFHLRRLDEQGLTKKISRRAGRVITRAGIEAVESNNVMSRMKFIVSKIDGLSYSSSFDLEKMKGTVVLNMSLIPTRDMEKAIGEIERAFAAGLGMGRLVFLRGPGEKAGRLTVPENRVGLGTVCSVTLNGSLLHMSVPVTSRYGCLLKMEDGQPAGFTHLVDYLGTTIDPLEIFIRAGMTSVGAAARSGTGQIGASFREVPAAAAGVLRDAQEKLRDIGLGGVLAVGTPNQPLLNVPVSEGTTGVAVVGGINPVAAAHEAGVPTESTALHSMADFEELVDYEQIRNWARQL